MTTGIKQNGVTAFPLLSEASKLMVDKKLDEAARLTMYHLRRYPNEPRGLAQLGTIAMQLGALGQAEHFFRHSLKHGAPSAEVQRNLGSILNQQERLHEALILFETLLKQEGDPSLRAIIAVILDKLGRTEEAMALRQALVDQSPENPFYWIALGHSLRAAGQVEDAINAYRAAIKADFECGEALW